MRYFGIILWCVFLFSFDNYNSFILGAKIGLVIGIVFGIIQWIVEAKLQEEDEEPQEVVSSESKLEDNRSFADRFYDFFYRKDE